MAKTGFSGRLMLLAMLVMMTGLASAERVARFYLEHTISRQVYGPILNRPGYRFQIGTDGYVVVEAPKGEVCFSTFPEVQYMGPFELETERIIALGKQAYSIVRLDSVSQPDIPVHIPVRPDVIVPPPVPMPTAPEARGAKWSGFETVEQGLAAEVWVEPMSRYKYDWELGGMEGKRGSDIKALRAGAGVSLGGWSLGLGVTMDAEHADSIIPPGLSVSDLRLEGGSGLLASLGYQRRLKLDRRWCALVGGTLTFRDESFDLIASTLTGIREPDEPDVEEDAEEDAEPPTPEEPTRVYETNKSKADLREIVLTLGGGIQYAADNWGARFEVLLHAFDDTDVKASLTVLGKNYELSGKRSHPLSVAFGGWFYPIQQLRLETRLSVGAETALRLGAAYEW